MPLNPPSAIEFRANLPHSNLETRELLHEITSFFKGRDYNTDMLELALAEAANNFVTHAQSNSTGRISVALDPKDQQFICRIIDNGQEFSPPKTFVAPTKSKPKENGFGWEIIKSICTEARVDRIGQNNHMLLRLPISI